MGILAGIDRGTEARDRGTSMGWPKFCTAVAVSPRVRARFEELGSAVGLEDRVGSA